MAIPIFCTFCSSIIGSWVKLLPPTLQKLDICVSSSVLFLFLNIVAVLCCSIEFCRPWSNRVSDIHFCLNSSTPEPPIAIVYRETTNCNSKSRRLFSWPVLFGCPRVRTVVKKKYESCIKSVF